MAETFRIAKAMKFIEKLRLLKKTEDGYIKIFANQLEQRLKEVFPNYEVNEQVHINKLVEDIIKYSYEKDGISFSHSEFSFFHETMFHLGYTGAIEQVIKEMGEFFDLDIPEVNKEKSDLEQYNIKSIDTKDYSSISRKFYIIVGGVEESFPKDVQQKCSEKCLNLLLKFVDKSKIEKSAKGFIIETPLQSIPEISSALVASNIGIYGIIPIEQKE